MRTAPRLVAALVVLVLVALGAVPTITGARGRGHRPHGAPPPHLPPPAEHAPHDRARTTAAPLAPTAFRYTQLDVGQGDAALLEAGDGPQALIDLGPRGDAPALLAALDRAAGHLAWVLVSHGHTDHYGGLEAALALGKPSQLFVPASPEEGAEWARTLAHVRAGGTRVVTHERGARLTLGAHVQLEVLAPSAPAIERSRSDVNANGVVVRADHLLASCTHRFLFTGDAELQTEARLVANPEALRADVLKVAHHGSGFSSSLRFLESVAPRFAVISAGEGNDYGHPHANALERLLGVGARVLRTDLHGTVAFTSDDAGIAVATEREVQAGAENVAPGGGAERLPKRHRPRHHHRP